jgi:hypothetical protein
MSRERRRPARSWMRAALAAAAALHVVGCAKVSGLDDFRITTRSTEPPPACQAGSADCDGDPKNGCETPLNTQTDCASCGDACLTDHGRAACEQSSCVIASCDPGFGDCDESYANGCETSLSTLADCGACKAACEGAHGVSECQGGACVIVTCSFGFDDCNGKYDDGCEVSLDTTKDCGSCGNGCKIEHGFPACQTGECAVAACQPGFGDCDHSNSTGCEADLTEPSHCGSCENPCPLGAACQAGGCVCPLDMATACAGACTDLQSDPVNCGSCGHSCLGGACDAGSCQPVVLQSGLAGPTLVMVSGSSVFWDYGSGLGISQSSVNGGAVTTTDTATTGLFQLEVHAGYLFWEGAAYANNEASDIIGRIPVNGGPSISLFTQIIQSPSDVSGLGIDGTYAWFSDTALDKIYKVLMTGGAPIQVAGAGPCVNKPAYLIVDAGQAYWLNSALGSICAAPTAGGPPVQVYGGVGTAGPILADAGHIYSVGPSGIFQVPKGGGAATTICNGNFTRLATDGSFIYWTDLSAGKVMRVPTSGGSVEVVAKLQQLPYGIAVDAEAIYWVDYGGNALMKLAK